MAAEGTRTVLCLGFDAGNPFQRLRLDGVRRYARTRGWLVDDASGRGATPETLQALLERVRPVGCVAECQDGFVHLPPKLFGRVPVVHFDPPESGEFRSAATVDCDNAAVAAAAFRELSAGLPPSFAVVSAPRPRRWTRERTAAFRALCRADGRRCAVFPERPGGAEGDEDRRARLAAWAAALPPRCAVFAVSDLAALQVLSAFAAAGRKVPRTATLVGADNAYGWDSAPDRPSVSSVRIDFELAGFLAMRLLAGKIAGAEPPARDLRFGPLMVERRQSTGGSGRRDALVMRAVERIRREACSGLTASALAADFPGSRSLFNLRFREATGHSVLDEIQQVRLQKALALLSGTDTAIGAVYALCGYRSGRALDSIFHARFGTSMREWRKRNRR